jgi:hypothetical protein
MGMGGNSGGMGGFGENSGMGGYRTATPNKRGQYSDAVMDELESQNEEQVGVLSGKVAELKNVRFFIPIPSLYSTPLPLSPPHLSSKQSAGCPRDFANPLDF